MAFHIAEDARIELHEARCCALSLVACGFRNPSRSMLELLADPAKWQGWPDVLITEYPETATVLPPLVELACGLTENDLPCLLSSHARLFGHSVRSRCPLYELEYARGEILQQAAHMADIAGFYAAFGLELSSGGHERHDHITAECEFLAVLAAKEAHAAGAGDAGALATLSDVQRKFLAEHAGRWIPALANRLRETDAGGFYGALGAFTYALIGSECRRLDIESGPELIELGPVELPEESAMTCGAESSPTDVGGGEFVPLRIEQRLIS
jgi:TorA maturation chaperone TorD